MDISIVTGPSFPLPPLVGGAMVKTWYALSQELARMGHRVSVFARTYPGQPKREVANGVHIRRTWGFAQSNSVALDLCKGFVYTANLLPRLPAADVLVTNDFWLPALATLGARRSGVVIVCAARQPKGQYRLYKNVSRVVALSSSVRDAIVRQQPVLRSRTVVIPLPVDTSRQPRSIDRPNERKKVLLYVGRVHPEKGISLLVSAFARIAARRADWRLRFVGPIEVGEGGGGRRFIEEMKSRANGLDLEFAGPIYEEGELRRQYRDADLFCYPSIAEQGEAFGVAVLEAMASGLPPVVSGLACFRDFVTDGVNGWCFDHRSAEADVTLADVLEVAMSDERRRASVGARALGDSIRFSYRAVAESYVDVFNGAIEAR